MKISDLRIGNYVQVNKYPLQVLSIYEDGVLAGHDTYTDAEFEGIPITPEILDKAGFHLSGGKWVHTDWLPYLVERKLYNTDAIWYQVFNVADCNIVYLHELQNIFRFTNFTGQELRCRHLKGAMT